jgi:ribosomal protein L16/L10AE
MRLASQKLPLKTKFVVRNDFVNWKVLKSEKQRI